MISIFYLSITFLPFVIAAPVLGPANPEITPPPTLVDRTPTAVYRRDLAGYVGSVLGSLGSDIPSYVASGVPNFFQNFPTGSAVESSLSISDSDLAATPTKVLNIPGYANWTDAGWNLRVHGNVYKQPNISQDDVMNHECVYYGVFRLTVASTLEA